MEFNTGFFLYKIFGFINDFYRAHAITHATREWQGVSHSGGYWLLCDQETHHNTLKHIECPFILPDDDLTQL